MKKFLSLFKHNVPWPLFVLGSILLAVSIWLKAPPGIYISGLMVLSSVVLFIYNCALNQTFKEEFAIRIKLAEARERADAAKIRRLYNNLTEKERESE